MAEDALFADLVGHTLALRLLRAALQSGRLAPAYLFAGPEGVGRRLAARRFLEGVLTGGRGDPGLRRRLAQGNLADLLWQEPTFLHQGQMVPASQAEALGVSRRTPPQIRLEQVREVSRFLGRRPMESPRPLVVIEAAEAMPEAAANALLKTLEEPGDGLLILISSAPERLLNTIRSRCQWIPFLPLSPAQMKAVLSREHGTVDATDDAPSQRPEPEELQIMAGGSPGALLAHQSQWQRLPEGLTERLRAGSRNPLAALELAREISEGLEGDQQLWLVQWWQNRLWNRHRDRRHVERLEMLRKHLLSHVQPRLAWEVTLLDLARLPGG
ncbi:MAG: DNA polymerase III subunit delta' [Cyanobacteriota bacterium]|nr:DNA polymerase III subunit delta' [Cyanobacteriota bacterium]